MFWTREIAGWLLVAIGLYAYLVCFGILMGQDKPVSAGIVAAMATMVFRGGIQLVKVAAAARMVQQARRAAESASPSGTRR